MNFQEKLQFPSYPEIEKLIVLSDLFGVSIDKLVKDYTYENCLDENKTQHNGINKNLVKFLCMKKRLPTQQIKKKGKSIKT